ncbi:MAG: PBP1A family penicillin-binding protein [Solibacillus sp.]
MTEKKRTREDIKRARQQEQKTKAKAKTKPPVHTWVKRIFLTLVLLGVLGVAAGAGLFTYYVMGAPELDEELLTDPVSSEFYDMNGELFATIGVENRTYIDYENIPQQMIDAIIATEDARFFEHFGIDIWRLGGAVVANLRDGFGAQGASTITQQVVKNSFFTNEKKLERKAQEAWLAIQLERKYSKEEIFEMYFNKVLMSGRVYGFGTAAEEFYGKELQDLTLDEMAQLAGMPQSPNNYNPYKHPENAKKRRDIVLSLMVMHGKISEAQATEAKAADVTAGLIPEEKRIAKSTTKYPAFLDVVLSELETNGDGEYLAEGVQVYTTLDPKAQTIVESVMNNDANFPTETIEAGAAVIDTQTGEIRAVGGGRNYGGDFNFNYAYDLTTRSPGSTLKPLIDYGPAIEHLKWSTGQTLVDKRITYSNSKQVITNWDGKYGGTMTAREALYTSRNIPAVETFREVGAERAKEFLANVGIKTDSLVESDAIGGGRINISPIQMAASYAAFGNNGTYHDARSITKVVFRDGKTSKSYKADAKFAMNDYTAYMVTDILRDVVSNKPNASAKNAIVPGVDIAGKTGTTNYSSDEFAKFNLKSNSVPDTWFTGYTTNYSIAIWGGYSQRKDAITTWDERWMPQRLFRYMMSDLNSYNPSGTFKQPSSVVSATIQVGSNPLKLASNSTPSYLRKTELFVKGTVPSGYSYEQVEEKEEPSIAAPFGLRASYNAAAQGIDVSWSHNGDDNYTFEVTTQITGGSPSTIVTGEKATFIPNATPGTYTFTITAISGEERSKSASTSLFIEGAVQEPEPTEPTEPSIENPETNTDNEDTGNNGNSGNNGNNNNNGNTGNNGENGNGNNAENNNGNTVVPEESITPAPQPTPEQPAQPEAPPVVPDAPTVEEETTE